MASSSLKIAVVGAGLIGKKHVELVTTDAVLHSIVDPAPGAAEIASAHGVSWFPDLAACLAGDRPDGVIVASPNSLHLEHGLLCLEAGVPVLIEKPLADTVASGRTLVQRTRDTGVPILVGHHRRHSPIIHAAHDVVHGGQLGQVVAAHAMFWLNKPADYFQADWRTRAGGGPVYINLIHDIDLLQYLCGPIASVQAVEANGIRGYQVEDTSAILLKFASGAVGTVTVSDTISAPWSWELTSGENPVYPKTDQSCYTIGGTQASLSIPDLKVWSHRGTQSWWSPIDDTALDVNALDPVAEQFRHFLDVVSGTADPLVTAEDGLRNIEVLEAVKSAARSGVTVHLDGADQAL